MNKLKLDNIITIIAILSLFFTFTNFIPISAIISATIIFLPFYIWKERKEMPKLTKVIINVFTYMAILVLIYDFKSLFKYEFYRRDGNLFITYAPLLMLSLIKTNVDIEKIFDKYLKFATLINLLYIIQFIFKNIPQINNLPIAFFLFYAHNAAGGYISTLLCLCIGNFMKNKNTINAILIGINTIALLLTNSRGSIIGVVIAIFILTIMNIPFKKIKIQKNIDIILFFIILVTIIIISTSIMIKLDEKVLKVQENEFVLPSELVQYNNVFDLLNRSHTIINRTCYLWPRAMKLFTESPIIGTGFRKLYRYTI